MHCPECGTERVVKNGITSSSGKQNYRCKFYGRQFVENPEHYRIPEHKRAIVDRLLLEKIPLAGIARTTQVSERWLQYDVNDKYAKIPRQVRVQPKKKAA